jgi:hypothetical protein
MRNALIVSIKRGWLQRPVTLWIAFDNDEIKIKEDPGGNSTVTIPLTDGSTYDLVVAKIYKNLVGSLMEIGCITRDRLNRRKIAALRAAGFQPFIGYGNMQQADWRARNGLVD